MKKLVIMAPKNGRLESYLNFSSFFEKNSGIDYIYIGSMDPWYKASDLIMSFHFKNFEFFETAMYYRLNIWQE